VYLYYYLCSVFDKRLIFLYFNSGIQSSIKKDWSLFQKPKKRTQKVMIIKSRCQNMRLNMFI